MEAECNEAIHEDMKGSDYLDACYECVRNLTAGSRDYNFYRAVVEFRDTMNQGKARITPIAMEFYEDLVKEVNRLKPSLIFY